MNIVMLSNTYTPHVGGVARSIEAFASQYRALGHKVLVIAPEFYNLPANEKHVIRVPALQHFNGSDFSVVLPVSGLLGKKLDAFKPDIVHAHHPFLLGMTALRIARFRDLPLVFTHHTLYERYTHYVPGDSLLLKRFVIELSTRFANLSDTVFAPSESIAALLYKRGVHSPIEVIPTGVETHRFDQGDGSRFRDEMGISKDAFVVGHLGRLAPEKNLSFLAQSVAEFISKNVEIQTRPMHFLVLGTGPSEAEIHHIFQQAGLSKYLHIKGILKGQQLTDAYHAMDVFAFSSTSETQGMVLTEAMTVGKPVVALDANGVREVVRDTINGRLLENENISQFATALQWIIEQPKNKMMELEKNARETAANFSMPNTAAKALACYDGLQSRSKAAQNDVDDHWFQLLALIRTEWKIIEGITSAAGNSLMSDHPLSLETAHK